MWLRRRLPLRSLRLRLESLRRLRGLRRLLLVLGTLPPLLGPRRVSVHCRSPIVMAGS